MLQNSICALITRGECKSLTSAKKADEPFEGSSAFIEVININFQDYHQSPNQ